MLTEGALRNLQSRSIYPGRMQDAVVSHDNVNFWLT